MKKENPKPGRPPAAQRYLDHAVQPDAVRPREIRLKMKGEIRFQGWSAFQASQTIRPGHGMLWRARSKVFGLPIRGYDKIAQGFGQCEWWLLGLLPLCRSRGRNISRSALGRMAGETIWNPAWLARDDIQWEDLSEHRCRFRIDLFDEVTEVTLTLLPSGAIASLQFMRWGNPNGLPYGLYSFGGYVDEEKSFGAFTIPTRLRLGWHFGTDRFAADGECYHVEIEEAEFLF